MKNPHLRCRIISQPPSCLQFFLVWISKIPSNPQRCQVAHQGSLLKSENPNQIVDFGIPIESWFLKESTAAQIEKNNPLEFRLKSFATLYIKPCYLKCGPGPGAAASPRSLRESQTPGPHTEPAESETAFQQAPSSSSLIRTLKFQKNCI